MPTLIDIVGNLSSYNSELTIYATTPWTCDSEAVVAQEPDHGGRPPEAESIGAVYFVEVFVASEFLEGWLGTQGLQVSLREQCERLVEYAVNDA